jgi:hypothetical protein
MYVKDLIKKLQELPQDLTVVLASDKEGNNFSKADKNILLAYAYNDGEIQGPFEDYVEAYKEATGDIVDPSNISRVVFIYPTN